MKHFFLQNNQPKRVKVGSIESKSIGYSLTRAGIQLLFLLTTLLLSQSISAQITGTAFRDFDGNGMQQAGEPGVGNIVVKFYTNNVPPATDSFLGQTTTAGDGTYSFNSPSYPVRIEFETPEGFCNLDPSLDYPAANGNLYGTSIQFAESDGVFNYILNYPADFAFEENPWTYTTCFINGDPLAGGNASSSEVLVGMRYNYSGNGSNSGFPGGGGPPHEIIGNADQLGSIWGIAISRQTGLLYAASFMKRHSGMGPMGSGGIYAVDLNDYSTSYNYEWLDFDSDLGIPTSDQVNPYTKALTGPATNTVFFSPVVGTNMQRGLSPTKQDPSDDPAAYEQVGKLSFGDIDISEDGRFLYVINLYDRKLYQIDLVDPYNPQTPTMGDVGTLVKGFDIPNPCTGNQGEHRPFAVKVNRGKVFIGTICSGQDANSQVVGTINDIEATVYEFDQVSETFNTTPVLQFPLNYREGTGEPWRPWKPQFESSYFEGPGFPMLSDIEFDGGGNMILGIMDRRGHQMGWQNYNLHGFGNHSIAAVGDILKAERDVDAMDCEYSIQFSPEFYKDDVWHREPATGGLSVHKTANSDNILSTFMDPVEIWSGGTMKFDNKTGNRINGYTIYYQPGGAATGPLGKAHGIGDIEAVQEVPLIEIGNSVWLDKDKDGIQDPDEERIPGVIIELLNSSGTVIATTTTDGDGEFYFNYSNVNDPAATNGVTGPLPYTDYKLRISPTQFSVDQGIDGGPLENLIPTLLNSIGAGQEDLSDNDASVISDLYCINFSTDQAGANDHTLDFGLAPLPDLALTHIVDPSMDYSNLQVGDPIKFKMYVCNQSDLYVDSLQVTDYIPAGYSFDASIMGNDIWSYDVGTNTAKASLVDLEGQETDSLCIYLRLVNRDVFDELINVAEISYAEDINGVSLVNDDIDSVLDDNPDNNGGSQYDTPADDYKDGDGTATEVDGVAATDQDNVDPAAVPICDLALTNTIENVQTTYSLGDTVKYIVEITNQGTILAKNIKINYHIPEGMVYIPMNDGLSPNWMLSGNIAMATIADDLPQDSKDSICIYLTVDHVNMATDFADAWTTIAEIDSYTDRDDNDKDDLDSTPDSNPNNDPGGNPDDATDNVVTGDGSGDPNDPVEDADPLLDEDDHDPAIIYICDAATIIYTDHDEPILYGDTVKYNIVVYNQGNGPITNIDLNNFHGGGLTLISTPVNDAENWDSDANVFSTTVIDVIQPGESDTTCIELVIGDWIPFDEDAYLQVVEIARFEDPNDPGVAKEDIDSTPDSNPENDSGGNLLDETNDEIEGDGSGDPDNPGEDTDPQLDEDDNDPVMIYVFDLALQKVIVDDRVYSPGEKPVFEITVHNQGNMEATSFQIIDYLSPGYSFSTTNNPGWSTYGDNLIYSSNMALPPGGTEVITLELTVIIPPNPVGVSDWWNYAEIMSVDDDMNQGNMDPLDADSDPNDIISDDNPVLPDDPQDNMITENGFFGGDEDDHDPAKATVGYDLALIKTVAPTGPYFHGDTLTYTLTIFNEGGLAVSDIEVYDSLPCGLLFIEDENDDWDLDGNIASTTLENVLLPGAMTTKDIKLVVQQCDDPDYDSYLNIAEISGFSDENGDDPTSDDMDSNTDDDPYNDGDPIDNAVMDPMDEDDHDIEDIVICDLALVNYISEIPDEFRKDDTVKFGIVVINQGNRDVNGASIDYTLPNGLIYLDMNNGLSPAWNDESDVLASIQTNNVIAPGESDTICIYLQLDNLSTDEVTEDSWTTIAEITEYLDDQGNPKTIDADSTPDDDPTNDPGGNPDDDTNDEEDGDGTGDPNDPVEDSDPSLDEDDHDAEIINVCDVATIIYAELPDDINYYDTLKYNVVISNQGNGDITNILIADHIPDGFEFVETTLNEAEGWEESEDIDDAIELLYIEVLAPGESDTICVEMEIVPVHDGSDEASWLQIVEVVQFEDPGDPDVPKDDLDSTPDDDPDNDSGGNPDDDTDDEVDGDGTGDPDDEMEDSDPALDEDDNDPVDTKVFDLALIMQIDSMPPVLPVVPGDILKFIIVVTNQGNTPANDVEITNYIMDENLVLASVSGNDDWDMDSSESNSYTIEDTIEPGEKDTICIYLEVIGGAMTDIVTYAEISGSEETDGDCYDIDSTPNDVLEDDEGGTPESDEDDHIEDDGKDGNEDGITDEDDHDPAMLDGQDLALIIWADQKEPVVEGQEVKFIIRVINQGNITNENIKIVNYLPEGFELSENDDNGWEYDPMNEDQVMKTLDGPLGMDEEVETCIVLTVQDGANALDLVNYAEIVSSNDPDGLDLTNLDIDSSPNNVDNDDTGGQYEDMPDCSTDPIVINDDNFVGGAGVNGEDEDDHDPAWVHVFDLASIIYTDRTTPIIPGDEIKFNVELHNQGNMSATDIDLLLQMPEGFTLSENDDNGWEQENGELSNTYEESLIPNQVDTVCVLLEVLPDFTLLNLIPIVEITGAMDTLGNERNDFDLDSKPNVSPDDDEGGEIFTDDDDNLDGNGEEGDDEDDHDPAVPPVMDLAIKIVTVDGSPKKAGDIVKFEIVVYNQGSMVPSEFTIQNYVPEGLIFLDNGENPGWVPEGATDATYLYDEDLLPLTSDTLCIYLEVGLNANPKNVVNMVEIIQIIDEMDNDVSLLDIDSESDNSNENDKGNDIYSEEDNKIDENGRSGDDEDDHDQAFVNMCDGIACKGAINLSIDESCQGTLTPTMLLTGDLFPDFIYEITVRDENGEVVPNEFGIGDVGRTFEVSITNTLCDNNTCWLYVTVEYKFNPTIECVPNDTISCAAMFDVTAIPNVNSNCVQAELLKLDEVFTPYSCDSLFTGEMTRTWIARDIYGNYSDTCTQVISVLRTNLDSITPVMPFALFNDNALNCSSGFATTSQGYPFPALSVTGAPRLRLDNGEFVDLYPFDAMQICNGFAEFEDEILPGSTSCVTKIMRTFTIGEWWCSETNEREFVQLIEVVDFDGPSIDCPADFTISTASFDCEGYTEIDLPVVSDACNGDNIQIDLASPSGFIPNYSGQTVMLPVGVHTLEYHAYDDCGNRTDCRFTVTVRDNSDPIAICDQFTSVGIGLESLTKVTAESIDDGSFDECGPVELSVARMDAPGFDDLIGFGDYVDITCDDVGNVVMVGLLVTDEGGNTNMCMVSIDVQDKIDAQMLCPGNMVVECNFPFDPDNLGGFFGEVEVFDNCPGTNTVVDRLVGDLNSCGSGVLFREISLLNAVGEEVDFCVQQIVFEDGDQLQYSDITPPQAEVTVTGCGPESIDPSILGMPIVPDDECQQVGIAMENDTFPFTENGACLKIIRTFSVIDWCIPDGPGSVLEPFEFVQIIKVNNTDGPDLEEIFNDTVFCSFEIDCGGIFISDYLTARFSDDCTSEDDLLNRYEVRDAEGDLVRSGGGLDASGFYDVGEYTVTFISEDKCGNQTAPIEQDFEVRSCKLPTPYCLQGLSTTLTAMDTTGDGEADAELVMLTPGFFDAGSYHPCGYDVTLSFSSDVNDTLRTFFCSDTLDLQEIELWVTDDNGGQDYCITFLDVQDNDTIDLCSGLRPVDIAGRVYTETDAELSDVAVELRSFETLTAMTDEDGLYEFADMPQGGNYKVKPIKDNDHMNGVSTLDLVKIQRHILQITPLVGSYKRLAADINNDEKISANDLLALRKMILAIDDSFPNNTSWRFVDSEYEFVDEENPWAGEIPEDYVINGLSEDMQVDFVAVKTGDVDDNVDVNLKAGIISTTRSANTLTFNMPEVEVRKEKVYKIGITSSTREKIYGFQYTLGVEGLEVVTLERGLLDVGREHMNQVDDKLHVSYTIPNGMEFNEDEVLFYLVIKSKVDGLLSQMVEMSSRGLESEFYEGSDMAVGAIEIDWKTTEEEVFPVELLSLDGNSPNPWRNSTEIVFYLPQAGKVDFIMTDVSGRIVMKRSYELKSGQQRIELSNRDVFGGGVYLYELAFNNQKVRGKMIHIE